MKLATKSLKLRHYPPAKGIYPPTAHQGANYRSEHDDDEEIVDTAGSHFSLTRKAAGITRKELVHLFGWSKTYIDKILNGTSRDPVEQCRIFCAELAHKKRFDLIGATLVEIAGGSDFDSSLFAAQIDAIKALAKT